MEILEKLRQLPYPTLKQLRRLSQHFISDLTHLLDMFINENRHTEIPGYTRFSSFSVREPEAIAVRINEDENFSFEIESWEAGNEKALSELMPGYEKETAK